MEGDKRHEQMSSSSNKEKLQESLDQLEIDLNKMKILLNEEDKRGSAIRNLRKRNQLGTQRAFPIATLVPTSVDTRHQTTLAVISLDPTPLQSDDNMEEVSFETRPHHWRSQSLEKSTFEDMTSETNIQNDNYCCIWPLSLLNKQPVLRLFVVMFFNGIFSMICSALIMQIEKPAQIERLNVRSNLQLQVDSIYGNLTNVVRSISNSSDRKNTTQLINLFRDSVILASKSKDEIPWDMLSSQAFITSVQTTTGYGDIIPVTFWGKFFTLIYGLLGIPIFMWYIVKLGAVFRLVVMKVMCGVLLCLCPGPQTDNNVYNEQSNRIINRRRSTFTRLRLMDLNMKLKEQYYDDKRFHPSLIGIILLVFLCGAAAFISYMESISYFDSFYASFITYSTIGFGDIDIFKISYRSNWFNLLIYGNFIHIVGYMILSAWVSSLLEKCGVRKF